MTHAQVLKNNIIALLLSYIDECEMEIKSGIEEGIYSAKDNKERLAQFDQERKLVESFQKSTPAIYAYISGGVLQGISGTEPIEVNVFDKDNYDGGMSEEEEKEWLEIFGTPEDWDKMIEDKTKDGTLTGIF